MNVNRKIIIAGVFITVSGILRGLLSGGQAKITPILLGGYIFLIVLSIADIFGGELSKFAGALAMLACVYVLIDVFPWQQVIATIQNSKAQ